MACSLAAAKQGADVILLEQSGQLGGTVVQTLIHTLGGLFDDRGDFLNPGLSVELTQRLFKASKYTKKRRIGKTWTLSVAPEVYSQDINDWIDEYPIIKVLYHSHVTDIALTDHNISEIMVTDKDSTHTIQPLVVIDTTGNADIVRQISEVTESQEDEALAGVIVRLRKVLPDTVKFPKNVALLIKICKAVENQKLPSECASLWFDNGVYLDEVYAKFNIHSSDYNAVYMEKITDKLFTYLQTLPEFTSAAIDARGQLGIRDRCSINGDYMLTEKDIKEGRYFTDSVCQACWPIEYWDPQQGVSLHHFPPGHRYDIPLRALKVKGVNNLFTAGKCLSAEPRARASARVVGTCWAMGEGLVKAIIG